MILGLDTSSLAASCALWEDGKLVGEFFTNAGLTHSQTVMPMLESLLSATRRELGEVDGFAVSAGPGSFTGLRIGIAAVKGMAQALGKPCLPVSTLEGLAANLADAPGLIAPVMDARCRQVYTGLFRSDGAALTRLEQDAALSLEELESRLEREAAPVILVGDGAALCMEQLRSRLPGLRAASPARVHQRAASVCRIAAQAPEEAWLPAARLAPSYLRLPQAQRELLKKQGKPTQ